MRKSFKNAGTLGILFLFCCAIIFGLALFGFLNRSHKAIDDFKYRDRLSFFIPNTAKTSKGQFLNVWSDPEGGISYIFLPSHAGASSYISLKDNGQVKLNGRLYGDNDIFYYSLDSVYEAELLDKNNRSIEKFQLVFKKSANIASAFISLENDLMYIHQSKDYKEKGQLCLIEKDGSTAYENGIALSGRGNSTWLLQKKGYNLTLDTASDILNAGSGNEFVLVANAFDESFVRNKLMMALAADVNLGFSPQSDYVDVYINNNYYGLYLICERIGIEKNKLDLPDLDQQNRILNQAKSNRAIRQTKVETETMKYFAFHYNPDDITGGYLLEIDKYTGYLEAESGFMTNSGKYVAIKRPVYASKEQVAYIKALFDSLESAINNNGYDASSGKYLDQIIDMESWAKRYILDEFSLNIDSGISSCYFYKKANHISPLIFAGPVWDFDQSLTNSSDLSQTPEAAAELYAVNKFSWYGLLYRNKQFYQILTRQYQSEFLPVLDDYLLYKIDEEIDRVYLAAQMDYLRWSNADERKKYRWFDDLELQREDLKRVFKTRMDYLASIWVDE